MGSIFISYRRQDTGGHAGRLFDRLRHWFDDDEVFFDLDGIDGGDEFPARLDDAVRAARVVLVVIGPDWLSTLNARARGTSVDFVRREVALALSRRGDPDGPRVIPVLFGGATMPSDSSLDEQLRSELQALLSLDAHAFDGKQHDWDNQFRRLRDLIGAQAGVPAPSFRPPDGERRHFRVIDQALTPHFQDPLGRLTALRSSLERGATAVVSRAALYGMGGVGKTQLALQYSHAYRDAYAGVWWLRSETEVTLQLDARDACLELAAHIPDGELPSKAFKRWLERASGTWLLVFDNAESAELLRPHLPESGGHHVLITSRHHAWGGLARQVDLQVWTPEQGAVFLSERLPGIAPADARALAVDLGGLPLALEQAASYIESTQISAAEYRRMLASVDTGGLLLDEGRAATGYERSVAATLSLAFDRLSPAAALLLRVCAFAAAEPLPERFFVEAADSLPDDLVEAARGTLKWNRVVGELLQFSLCQRARVRSLDAATGGEGEETEPALVFHRLLQQVVRGRLATPAEDCRRMQAVLVSACDGSTDLPLTWPRFAAAVEHVVALERFLERGWTDRRGISWLLDTLGKYLRKGPTLYRASAALLERAIALDAADLGEEHPATLTSMGNLASTLSDQGDLPSARALKEQVLAGHRRALGEEHPATLTSMNNLAETLRAQGDLPGARALQEEVLAMRRRVLGGEHPDTLTSMNNLAGTLAAQGDLAGARALEKLAFETRRRVLGEAHPDTLTSMNNLAGTLSAQGDLASARALQEQVLAMRRDLLGGEHPVTLTAMNNLAGTLRAEGDLASARALLEQVLAMRRRVLGAEHPATLTSMNNLADTLWALGDLLGARAIEEHGLAARRRVLGEEHPDTLMSMNNLASTLWSQGDLVAARALQEQALAGNGRLLGEDHPRTLESLGNLAAILWQLGDADAALRHMAAAAAGLARTLGSDHPTAREAAAALAYMREQLGLPPRE